MTSPSYIHPSLHIPGFFKRYILTHPKLPPGGLTEPHFPVPDPAHRLGFLFAASSPSAPREAHEWTGLAQRSEKSCCPPRWPSINPGFPLCDGM